MQTEKLKRTKIETKMNKKAEKIKQKFSRNDNLSKNGQGTNEIQSETLCKNRISNFLNKILGVEEKARGKLELKSEKEVPDSDCKTTKFQKPVERKLKKPKKKKSKLKKKVQKKEESN